MRIINYLKEKIDRLIIKKKHLLPVQELKYTDNVTKIKQNITLVLIMEKYH